jgi:glycosyltransferase involved in cell wall biosynthesis
MADGSPWPRITVVTPSFNQAQYLEETIRSVLLQGYPNLEYLVIDGGSTDGSVEILERYAPWLDYWVSERDRGQAHAINKGFARCTGDVIGWINSDDLLLPGAFRLIGEAHRASPDAVLLGDVIDFDDATGATRVVRQRDVTLAYLLTPWSGRGAWHQPGIYVPLPLHRKVGPLDETLRYAFDQEWMCRLLREAPTGYLGAPVARFRLHGTSKTVGEATQWLPEQANVLARYSDQLSSADRRAAWADLYLWGALNNLSVAYRNRWQGIAFLLRALHTDWRTIWRRRFIMLCVAALLPQPALRAIRNRLGTAML